MHFFRFIEHLMTNFAGAVPLPIFVFVGSFLEEVISPIPSALVMGTAGSFALVQGKTWIYLFFLAFIGNFGKTLGAWFYYFIGDKLEDIFVKPITKYLGVKHTDIEDIGKRFMGHHLRDGSALFLIRLLPPFPTTPVSIACGIIKMDVRVFLLATYLGNFFKDLVYLYIGYAGLASLHSLWRRIDHVKFFVNIGVAIAIISLFIFFFLHQGRGRRFLKKTRKYSVTLWHRLNGKK